MPSILGERHLYRIVSDFLAYYRGSRPHQSLERNAPLLREVEAHKNGLIFAEPMVSVLHHRYRRATRRQPDF
jgi:hypothetical protein